MSKILFVTCGLVVAAVVMGCTSGTIDRSEQDGEEETLGQARSAVTIRESTYLPPAANDTSDDMVSAAAPRADWDCGTARPKANNLSFTPVSSPAPTFETSQANRKALRRLAAVFHAYLVGGPNPSSVNGSPEFNALRTKVWDKNLRETQARLCYIRHAVGDGSIVREAANTINICGIERGVSLFRPADTSNPNVLRDSHKRYPDGTDTCAYTMDGLLAGSPEWRNPAYHLAHVSRTMKLGIGVGLWDTRFPTFFQVSKNGTATGETLIDPEIATLDANLGTTNGSTAAATGSDGSSFTVVRWPSTYKSCKYTLNGTERTLVAGQYCSSSSLSIGTTVTTIIDQRVTATDVKCACTEPTVVLTQ